MANRIVVTDGNWQDDNLVLVPRQQLPITVGNLPAGDYLVVNTLTGPDTATATNSPTAAPLATRAEIQGTSLPTGILTAVIEGQGSPTPSVESIQWTLDGADIPGATGMSLDKAGLAADAVVSYRFVLANGILPKFEGVASNPVRISPLPQITGVVSPNPIRPGEAFTLFFDPIPDTATMTTVPGDVTTALSGTGQQRSGTAPQSGSIEIDAAKVDHAPFGATYEVVPYPAALSREDNLAVITNATSPTEITISLPDDLTSPLNGTHTGPGPSQTGAPVWIAGPYLTVDGPDLVLDPGTLYIQDARIASVDWAWPDLTTGLRWPYRPEDEGTTFPLTVNAVDDLGREASVTVSVAIPASTLAAGITSIGRFDGTNTTVAKFKDIAINLGPANAQKTMLVAVEWGPETLVNQSAVPIAVKIVKDGTEYMGTSRAGNTIYQKGRDISLWEVPCAVGGVATLKIEGQQTAFPGIAYVLAGKNVSFITTSNSNNLSNAVAMTAGSQFGSTRTTVVGDHVLFVAIADQINTGGLFTVSSNLTEIHDQTIRGEHQLLVAKGTATTTSTTSGATPTATGLAAFIHAIYRDNP